VERGSVAFVAAASAVLERHFTTGSLIVGTIVAAAGLAVLAYGARWKSAWQVASTQANELRKALDDERSRGDRLEARLNEAMSVIAEQKEAITRLEQLPNLETLVRFMDESTRRAEQEAQARTRDGVREVVQRIERHEELSAQRHLTLIKTLRPEGASR